MNNDIRDDKISSPPPGKARYIINLFIITFLIFQIILPASYYFGIRKNIYDERFSWRMFSSNKLQLCNIEIKEHLVNSDGKSTKRESEIKNKLDEIWLEILTHNVTEVAHKLLRKHCNTNPWITEVSFKRRCRTASGKFFDPDKIILNCVSDTFSYTRGQN